MTRGFVKPQDPSTSENPVDSIGPIYAASLFILSVPVSTAQPDLCTIDQRS